MGITVRGISYYHPLNKVENGHFRTLYKEKGVDIERQIHSAGRKFRYISNDKNENTLTMATKAVEQVLKNNNLTGKDIDMLIFSSDTPEYLAPANCVMIHRAIKGKENMVIYDMNANCAGMLIAFEQVNKYMQLDSKIKRAVIVGSQQLSKNAKEDTVLPFISFGDLSTAVLLERTDYDCGLVDSSFFVDSNASNEILIPEQGFSNACYNGRKEKDLHWELESRAYENAPRAISEILEKNNIDRHDVKRYFLSQFVHKEILRIAGELGVEEEKFTYAGHKFGYTGTTSPFLAFARALHKGEVTKGDTVVLWTVGAGWNTCAILFKL